MSHFVSAEAPDPAPTRRQIAAFEAVRAAFPQTPASLANCAALFVPTCPHLDLVRPGYALYGGNPTPGAANPMRPVVRLQAPILQIRAIKAGETVGYNARWTARRPTRLAAVGIGYADGLPRAASGLDDRAGAMALVRGVRRPLVGRISMDLSVIDVTDAAPDLAPGEPVDLLGPTLPVEELAAAAGTIGYEILTSLGRRYRRDYVS